MGHIVDAFDPMKTPVVPNAWDLPGGSRDRPQAVAFEGCFGWLHQTIESAGNDTAVLLCAGLGRDASTAHRSFRILADQLAGAGYPTLRFDYPNTGDSRDIDGPHCWAAWQLSVQAAADLLRDRTGARRIVMIGLRIGATLAVLAATTRDDVAGLVLLEPVLRGKSYVSQLTVESRLRNNVATTPDDSLEFDGVRLDSVNIKLLRQIDLRQVTVSPRCSVSIFSQFRTPVLAACLEAWRDAGVPVACDDLASLDALLRPCHLTDGPNADFTPILSWLRTATPPRQIPGMSTAALPNPVALQHPDWVETPLRFGEHRHLFGILCRPSGDTPRDLAVIIGNTGGDPHHGFARFTVEFARRLAINGIASLRIDFAGLGDSIGSEGDGEAITQVFGVDRNPDFGAAIDTMQQLGFRRFALNGLCSGAYHAFLATVADVRVGMLLPINLPWFTLRYDKPGPTSLAGQAMAELSDRQVRTLLLYSAGDPGLTELEKHFGRHGDDLRHAQGAVVSIVAGLDHDLTGRAMRQTAADRMISFLLQTQTIGHRSLAAGASADSDPIHALVS